MSVAIELTDSNLDESVQQAAGCLADGGVVRLCLQEGWWGAALAPHPRAGERFLSLNETSPAALMLPDAQAARDFVPSPSRVLERLMRGGSGPLLVALDRQDVDSSLLEMLPEATRQLVSRGQHVALAPPSGPVMREVLRRAAGPLLVCSSQGGTNGTGYDMLITEAGTSPTSPTEIHVSGDRWDVVTTGNITAADVERMMAKRILFVCTGNTCRSPMAEGMFRALLAERLECEAGELLDRGYDVASAGLAAMSGAPAAPESVQLCAERGVDLRSHSSQPLTESLLVQADRLYTMTAGHREAILSRYPELSDRVEVLSRSGRDVTDPIGCGPSAYEQSFTEITENLRVLVDELTRTGRGETREDAES
jgi:L-threonylcarbamoyladenylate synthase